MIISNIFPEVEISKEEFKKAGILIEDDFIRFKIEEKVGFSPYNDEKMRRKYHNQTYYDIFLHKNDDKIWILLDWVGFPKFDVFDDGSLVDMKGILQSVKSCMIDYFKIYQSIILLKNR